MCKFNFNSMTTKYENFTGKKWNYNGTNGIGCIKNFAMVSLEGNKQILDEMNIVRDWCQEHFEDDWIYDWNDFYFIKEEDAMMFKLRWA